MIDPGDDIEEITAILDKHQVHVKTIVITHAHIDHIGGAAKLRALSGAPVFMNVKDGELASALEMQAAWLGVPVPENPGIDVEAHEGDVLTVGETAFQVIETPGHTQGSITLYAQTENKLVAGDTLFRDSVGRTDLPGGDGRQILSSIHTKLLTLPESTIVIPGHGSNTTIGREKEFNPFLSKR